MSVSFADIESVGAKPTAMNPAQRSWWVASMALLSVRFIQGFIYWGGGSRRFIYAPAKLDPNAPTWMANKFQTAMPGALLGMDHVMSYMLTHFYVLYVGVILFSAAEFIAGAMLMVGLMTRFAALVTMGFSVLLMLMFGWQGATCIDEWTMAACNLAMGTALLLGGGGAYSVDNLLLKRAPGLAHKGWFRWASGSLPLPGSVGAFKTLALALFAFVVIFNVSTYNYYRGSVVTPYHGGPVNPSKHHITVTKASLTPDGGVRFHLYLDGGTPEAQAHVMNAALLGADKKPLAKWDTASLSKLPKTAFANDYPYNKFGAGPFGIRAPMGAAATLTLPAPVGGAAGAKFVQLTDVDGSKFLAPLGPPAA